MYNCATSSMEQPYSLAVPQDTINTFSEEELRAIPSLNNDNENTNCVEIITNYGNGSGILIDGNVIATAAHCIYDLNLGFPTNVTINIYNQNCTQIIATASAKKLHIPSDYANSTSTYRPNYDYGLIYFDNITFYDNNYDPDLDIVNIGVMTDEFMTHIVNPSTQSTSTITLSGITSSNISGYTIYPKRRYFHAGQIMNMNDLPIEKPYRFKSSAHCIPGQSGGKVYYKPTVNYKSTVGIATHSTGNNVSDPNYGLYSYGIRMTPTILRFFLNNPNIS